MLEGRLFPMKGTIMPRRLAMGVVTSVWALVSVSGVCSAQTPPRSPNPTPSRTPSTEHGPIVDGNSLTESTREGSPSGRFGAKGALAISSDAALSISHTSISGADASVTTLQLAPSLDYFVAPQLSVGGSVFATYSSLETGHSTNLGIGPRVGYNFPLSDLVSVWPKIGFSVSHTNESRDVAIAGATTVSQSTSNTAVALNLFAPLMFHPAQHFFAGFGPYLDADLSGDTKATTVGGKLTLGGWFPL